MIRTILNGSHGRMGRTLTEMIASHDNFTVIAGVDPTVERSTTGLFPIYSAPDELREDADVVIDFSLPQAIEPLLDAAIKRNLPVVIATTGLTDEQFDVINDRSSHIAILQSVNMSLGINLLKFLVRKTAQVLGGAFDVEIVEKHHRMKKDAPSGTAFALAEALTEARSARLVHGREGRNSLRAEDEIGIHAVRGGTVVGEHDVIFAGPDEVITLRHTAYSRKLFATGALKAAAFLVGRPPGLYTMDDVLAAA